MKLYCSVKIHNRLLPSLSMSSSVKYKKAVISVVKPSKESPVYLVVVTQNNKAGSRYKIPDNIEKTFGQFINEGKCTIRFKDPSDDLCIVAETIPLKNFMLYMKKVCKGELRPRLNINKEAPQCKTKSYKLEIKNKEDYPVLKGFPSTLEILLINDCKLSRLDTRIPKLKNLTTLSLSRNKITAIPVELGSLYLEQLFLDGNDLKNENWKFLSGAISKSLKYLNLSGNEMKYIPSTLSRFYSLRILKAGSNLLMSIPFGICSLPELQELDLSNNQIRALPGTIKRRWMKKLDTLDVSGNETLLDLSETCAYMSSVLLRKENHNTVSSLLEMSAQTILNSRLQYNEELIPHELVRLLDNAGQCSCGKTIIKGHGLLRYTVEVRSIVNTFVSTERQQSVPVVFTSCSANIAT